MPKEKAKRKTLLSADLANFYKNYGPYQNFALASTNLLGLHINFAY